jgi:hypothetical protein
MIYNLTSIKRVIAKVLTDRDAKEGDHRISDMIEWSGEALEKISAFPYFETKVAGKEGEPLLELVNYQAKLPAGFHRLIQVGYSLTIDGAFYPMRYATGSFEGSRGLTTEEDVATLDNLAAISDADIVTLAMTLYSLEYEDALLKINNEPSTRSILAGLLLQNSPITEGTTSRTTDYVYVVTPGGWIKTNQESGYLMMSYQAIPLDGEGYPLVPDDQSFLEALYWYINMKLMYPDWVAGRVRDAVYYDARRSWNYYCKQAYGNAMMPSADQLESFKNSWLRLVPEIKQHSDFFSTLGQEQVVYNKDNIANPNV